MWQTTEERGIDDVPESVALPNPPVWSLTVRRQYIPRVSLVPPVSAAWNSDLDWGRVRLYSNPDKCRVGSTAVQGTFGG